MTRKRISKRIAKHAKTYKGGATNDYDTSRGTYQSLIETMNNKLNLNLRNEGEGFTYGKGCLNYLIAMANNLYFRPEFKKYNANNISRITLFIANVKEVQTNYTELVKAFKTNDPEITFQIILGCIQVLYTNMCDLLSYLPVGVFDGYELYLIDKTELFAKEIETLKNIEHIKNRTMKGNSYEPISYEPIIIGNNIALYSYWKEHKNDKVETQISHKYIEKFIDCKNWRRNMIKTKKNIIFIDYFEDDDACKKADEKADTHRKAKLEQTDLQTKLQIAEDREAAEDSRNKSKKEKVTKETGTSI